MRTAVDHGIIGPCQRNAGHTTNSPRQLHSNGVKGPFQGTDKKRSARVMRGTCGH